MLPVYVDDSPNPINLLFKPTTKCNTMNIANVFSPEGTAAYLRTLPAIRERCGRVFELAQQDKLEYFEYHPAKEADVAAFCTKIIQVR
jgi:hypothetical protein